MLSINTNLSSLIAQNSMKTSTDKLNQAIERMTTGLKINHASDNAANYSISTNLTTQLSAYDTAADNVAMGMDLVNYASDIISQMQDKAARLNALSTQARNGTYGAQSLSALNSEASAIMSELMRLYSTAEYNDISLFNKKEYTIPESLGGNPMPVAKAEYNGFIADPVSKEQSYVDALTSVTEVTQADGFTESEYKIESVEALVKLAELTNACVDTTGKTFYLAKDLDLGAYCDAEIANGNGGWTPIGDASTNSNFFKGTFDGNGHVIKNLKIDRETMGYQGLFGVAETGELKNIGLENVDIKGGSYVGGLAGIALAITNCYATGNISGKSVFIGGLVGGSNNIINSYSIVTVSTSEASTRCGNIGGLAGCIAEGDIINCFAKGSIISTVPTTALFSERGIGGLVGSMWNSTIDNSYSEMEITGLNNIGGLVGNACSVSGQTNTISNSISYSKINCEDISTAGSLIAMATMTEDGTSFGTLNISNCQARPIEGMNKIGGAFSFQTDPPTAITYDLSTALSGISDVELRDISTTLQVGIYGDNSCQLNFDTNFEFNNGILSGGIESVDAFDAIVAFENLLSEKATQLGAVQNRLDSALESIEVNINNLTSSRSTIRDADIAEVSSQYIQQQILQQASATLMATANQSPAIALQLI